MGRYKVEFSTPVSGYMIVYGQTKELALEKFTDYSIEHIIFNCIYEALKIENISIKSLPYKK